MKVVILCFFEKRQVEFAQFKVRVDIEIETDTIKFLKKK